MNKIKIEVGCGANPTPDYIHCDIRKGHHIEYVCNAWAIPFNRESVDEIYSRHMLEHLTLKEATRALSHWYAILKIGGTLEIIVPDLEKHLKQYYKCGNSPYVNFTVSQRDHALAGFFGWQKNNHDVHKWGYTFDSLSELLLNIGFSDIKRQKDHSVSGELSLYLKVVKLENKNDSEVDSESKKKGLFYYNKKILLKNVLKKFKINIIFFKLLKIYRKLFKTDYGNDGERQVAVNFDDIREDHKGRYILSCHYIKDNDLVLDCACGIGYGSHYIANHSSAAEIYAIDIDKKAIKFASKHFSHRKIFYQSQDIFSVNTNIYYHRFDVIICFETLEHLEAGKLIGLFYHFLKKDGVLIISTPNEDKLPFNKIDFPYHLKHFTPKEFENLLCSGKFEVMKKFTQQNKESSSITHNWDGLYNIAIAKKSNNA